MMPRHTTWYFGFLFLFFTHAFTFQLLDNKPWSQVSSFLPPGSRLQFYCAWGSVIPLLVDFSWSVGNSRSLAFRKSTRAQEKSPHEFIRVCIKRDSNSRNCLIRYAAYFQNSGLSASTATYHSAVPLRAHKKKKIDTYVPNLIFSLLQRGEGGTKTPPPPITPHNFLCKEPPF